MEIYSFVDDRLRVSYSNSTWKIDVRELTAQNNRDGVTNLGGKLLAVPCTEIDLLSVVADIRSPQTAIGLSHADETEIAGMLSVPVCSTSAWTDQILGVYPAAGQLLDREELNRLAWTPEVLFADVIKVGTGRTTDVDRVVLVAWPLRRFWFSFRHDVPSMP